MSSRPRTQRRDRDDIFGQTEEEILAKAAGLGALLEIVVGGRDDAHVEIDPLGAADPANSAILERSQQGFLAGQSEISDLVEKDCPAVGGSLETAAAAFDGSGERPFFMTEEFAVGEGLGDGATIDDDERTLGARAVLVKVAGDDLLAGAGLAVDDDGILGRDDGFDLGDQSLDGRTLSHGRGQRGANSAGGRAFCGGSPRDRSPHGFHEMLIAKRLGDVFEGPLPDRADRPGNAAVGGDDDDRQAGIDAPEAPQHLFAAEAGHPHVEKHRGRRSTGSQFEPGSSGIGFRYVEPGIRQDIPHGPPHVAVVVN